MKQSPLGKITEVRRIAPIISAVMMVVALAFPMWRIILTAPQYASRELVVRLYAYPRLEGDVREVATLNHYVGFHFPDPVYLDPNFEVAENAFAVPEWSIAPAFFVAMAIDAILVSLSSDSAIEHRLKLYFFAILGALVAILAWVQFRLYQVGHNLDESAPMMGVDGFTPPVLGGYHIANISGNAWFDVGGYILVAAIALLGVGYLFRESDATVRELPQIIAGGSNHGRTPAKSK